MMKTEEKQTPPYAEAAERLREALQKKNNGNQSELARFAECTPQAVNKWLSGTQFPRDAVLQKTAEFLNVTPEYLRFGTPNVRPPTEQAGYRLDWVSTDEFDLLSDYRESTAAGKTQMRAAGLASEKQPRDELPVKPE